MNKKIVVLIICTIALSFAQELSDTLVKFERRYWDNFEIRAGVYFTDVNSRLLVTNTDRKLAFELSSENVLHLADNNTTFRLRFGGRIKQRHYIECDMFLLRRFKENQIGIEIPIGDDTIPINANVATTFNLDFYRIMYNYSLFHSQNIDLFLGIGAHIIPMSYNLNVRTDSTSREVIISQPTIIPLPVVSIGTNFMPRYWYRLNFNANYFFFTSDALVGKLYELALNNDFRFSRHLGIGIGLNTIGFQVGQKVLQGVFGGMTVNIRGISLNILGYW